LAVSDGRSTLVGLVSVFGSVSVSVSNSRSSVAKLT
jgi:hypothetical protein